MSDNRNENRETVDDVLEEMRGMGNYQRYSGDHAHALADRIEAAWKREREEVEAARMSTAEKSSAVGNAAAMRDALENSNGLLEELAVIGEWGESAREQIAENNAALSAPPRNCDVGTAEEQIKRWEKFCQEHHEYWKPGKSLTAIQRCNCPCYEGNGCNYFIWAQMPYEQEGGAK